MEIGANAAIDRALIGVTLIGEGSKLDNMVQIAHNCEMGKHNLICGHTAWAGSVTSEDYVTCAGQVGIADHLHIGEGAVLAAQAGVTESLEGGRTYFGSPAQEIMETRKQVATLRRLPEMRKQLRELASQIKSLRDPASKTVPIATTALRRFRRSGLVPFWRSAKRAGLAWPRTYSWMDPAHQPRAPRRAASAYWPGRASFRFPSRKPPEGKGFPCFAWACAGWLPMNWASCATTS